MVVVSGGEMGVVGGVVPLVRRPLNDCSAIAHHDIIEGHIGTVFGIYVQSCQPCPKLAHLHHYVDLCWTTIEFVVFSTVTHI